MARSIRVPTLVMQRHYRDLQIIARTMLFETSPEIEQRQDYESIVDGMVSEMK